jgi:hypothetical protein
MPALLHALLGPNRLGTCHHGWLHCRLVGRVVACRSNICNSTHLWVTRNSKFSKLCCSYLLSQA